MWPKLFFTHPCLQNFIVFYKNIYNCIKIKKYTEAVKFEANKSYAKKIVNFKKCQKIIFLSTFGRPNSK